MQEAGGGTITPTGLYTAPATAGTFHVVATSVADPTKSATATVTVTPATPQVSLSPTSLSFAARLVRTTSAARSVTLTNTGAATLNITSISFTGAAPGDYAFDSGTTTCPTAGGTVAAGDSCTMGVTFTPSAEGARNAQVSITDDAPDSPQTVPLEGKGELWVNTGNLSTPRFDHTATRLNDGRVLVVGGSNGTVRLNSAEIYDPSTDSWSSTGSLPDASLGHTATLLISDGRVLVAGGGPGAGATNTYLFDPATGTFSDAGFMNDARTDHTATLLDDGRVLVAGGTGPGGILSSAEIYDPAAGAWSSAEKMADPREFHTATRLVDGRVLVAGGNGASGALFSAEIFDPASGTWSVTGNLGARRANHGNVPRWRRLPSAGGRRTRGTSPGECRDLRPEHRELVGDGKHGRRPRVVHCDATRGQYCTRRWRHYWQRSLHRQGGAL